MDEARYDILWPSGVDVLDEPPSDPNLYQRRFDAGSNLEIVAALCPRCAIMNPWMWPVDWLANDCLTYLWGRYEEDPAAYGGAYDREALAQLDRKWWWGSEMRLRYLLDKYFTGE